MIDNGLPVLRVKFTLNFMGFLPTLACLPVTTTAFRRELTVDLFDKPERERVRPAVVTGMQIVGKVLASQLGTHASATQRAAQVQRLMDSAGVIDLYSQADRRERQVWSSPPSAVPL